MYALFHRQLGMSCVVVVATNISVLLAMDIEAATHLACTKHGK